MARTEDALGVIGDLAREAAVTMDERGEGGRRFAVRLFRSDGATRALAVETSLPTRDPALVLRLFGERIDGLVDPLDPGFGFRSEARRVGKECVSRCRSRGSP